MTTLTTAGAVRRRRWRRALRARRRWLTAVLAAGAVVFALESLAPPAPPTDPVVVAATDLEPGHLVEARDLAIVRWPRALTPASALTEVGAAVGRTVAGAVGKGEAVTGLRLVGPSMLGQLARTGRVAVPVRLGEPDSAQLLRPGDLVDLVAARSGAADPIAGGTGPTTAEVVAAEAIVITVPRQSAGGAFTVGSSTSNSPLVLVAVTRSESLALARAAVLGPVSVVLVG